MKKKQPKRGLNPLVAIVLLIGSMAVVGKSMLGAGPAPSAATAVGAAADANPDDGANVDAKADGGVLWQDLLADFGSYQRGGEVRHAFAEFEYPSTWTGPTGAGTGAEAPVGRWVGEDPPVLRLGVVMVSQGSRRAVLGGKVVGVGDAVGGGTVTAIEPGVVLLQWAGRNLTYDLDSSAPREFRPELAHRKHEQAQQGAAAAAAEAAKSSDADRAGVDNKSAADKKDGNQ